MTKTLIRVYQASIQRVACELSALNCFGAFILVDEKRKLLFGWIGSKCSKTDQAICENLGAEIKLKELKQNVSSTHIMVIKEGEEDISILDSFFSTLGSSSNEYSGKSELRMVYNC